MSDLNCFMNMSKVCNIYDLGTESFSENFNSYLNDLFPTIDKQYYSMLKEKLCLQNSHTLKKYMQSGLMI